MSSVRFEHVGKVYDGDVRAVDDLCLSVGDGEFMVLVGPSGCGKSTALRMVAGLEEISDGEISIGERVVNRVHPRDRDVAMVFQNYALYPHMTVFENIAFGLKMRHVPRAAVKERVTHIAETLGLSDLLSRRPRQLSGGQRQRVAMGRAIVRDPAVFLLDEPLSNLDARLRSQMRSEITAIQRGLGATTLYVTHDQVEAMTMGDRVAVMRRGRLQQVGTPDELYFHPANLFVASFLGNPPMNLFEARLVRAHEGWLLQTDDQALGPLVAGELDSEAAAALRTLEGAVVGVGIRPEDLKESSGGSGGVTLRGAVSLAEALGSDRLLHLEIRARPVVEDAVLEVAEDADATAGENLRLEASERRAHVIARVPPSSRVATGDVVEVSAQIGTVYIFDLTTGRALRPTGGFA